MSMVALGIAAVAVSAGTTIYGNEKAASALKKSSAAQQAAIRSLEPLNIRDINRIASKAEIEQFTKSIETQRQLDPNFAALREQGGANALQTLMEDADPNSRTNRALAESDQILKGAKEGDEAIIAQLLDRVKADLDAGATLPPEFQAELVKSGLETAGARGLNLDGRGAAGVGVRTLLGSAGLDLKERREANARTNLSAADTLRQNRLAALERLGVTSSDVAGARLTRGVAGTVAGNSNMPTIGLSGADAAGIAIQNAEFRNAQKLGIAASQNQNTMGQAALKQSTAGAIGSSLNSAAGMGGYGTWVGGLLKKAPTTA